VPLFSRSASLCLAPWDGDGHPDHNAAGRAATNAASRTGAALLQYLVWTWHWATPGDLTVPWDRAAQLVLTGPEGKAKRRAIDAFDSQVRPLSLAQGDGAILDAHEIAHHTRGVEVFLT
jgi:LmbE family N-acetylglucosaminyl deacetylase